MTNAMSHAGDTHGYNTSWIHPTDPVMTVASTISGVEGIGVPVVPDLFWKVAGALCTRNAPGRLGAPRAVTSCADDKCAGSLTDSEMWHDTASDEPDGRPGCPCNGGHQDIGTQPPSTVACNDDQGKWEHADHWQDDKEDEVGRRR